jgi:predicted nucleic acid-binding protein
MRILVDTSVWVDFFNGYASPEARTLAHLIEDEADLCTCGVVVAEFFQGIRDRRNLQKLEHHFREMLCLTPREPDTYFAAASLFRTLRAQGITVRSTIDCLVAQLAAEGDALLLAKDRDMRLIIDSGTLRVRPAPLLE